MRSLFIIFIFIFTFAVSNLTAANNQDLYKKLDVFGDVFDLIKKNYVEEVDDEKVIEYAINGMLQSLDPHSGYMDAEIYVEMKEETKGEFGGLAIEVTTVSYTHLTLPTIYSV